MSIYKIPRREQGRQVEQLPTPQAKSTIDHINGNKQTNAILVSKNIVKI